MKSLGALAAPSSELQNQLLRIADPLLITVLPATVPDDCAETNRSQPRLRGKSFDYHQREFRGQHPRLAGAIKSPRRFSSSQAPKWRMQTEMDDKTNLLSDSDWAELIQSIDEGRLTPFLGAGISWGLLPLGGDIARDWAAQYKYPLSDTHDLISVSQFLAIERFPMFPKDEIARIFRSSQVAPDFKDVNQPHGVLADLPITTYLTTNYDAFMEQALVNRFREPKTEICRWNTQVQTDPLLFDGKFSPTVAVPVVFHLHGTIANKYSLVLTRDDYVDFLVNLSANDAIVPQHIRTTLTQTSLLFIGYGLADWNFQVLLRSLWRFMETGVKRRHLALMLPPKGSEDEQQRVCNYWSKYFQRMDISVCWANAVDFLSELRKRWRAGH